MSALIPPAMLLPAGADGEALIHDWLADKSVGTVKAYGQALRAFNDWSAPANGVSMLLLGRLDARRVALAYRRHLQEQGKSPATVNRALSALRSLVALARDCGLVDYELNVKGLKSRAYRDTTGLPRGDVIRLVEAAQAQTGELGVRDEAIVRLLYGLGLRRSEVVGLRVCDVELGAIWVLGKGKHERQRMTLPESVNVALIRWMEVRAGAATNSPVFVALDHNHRGHALSGYSVARMMKRLCAKAGVRYVSPHGLRHSAVTHALDATNGNYRLVRSFSRHASIQTIAVYDDNRKDGAGQVAGLLDF